MHLGHHGRAAMTGGMTPRRLSDFGGSEVRARPGRVLLLANRAVLVDSSAEKEAVMHHAEPKEQEKDNKEAQHCDPDNLQQGCIPFLVGR
jgi:hypothetical protein